MTPTGFTLNVLKFGQKLLRYSEFIQTQTLLNNLRKAKQIPDTLLTLQYHPVYTIGKRGSESHFLTSKRELKDRGFEIVQIGRGGEVTYHGPGQIVLYPVIDIRERRVGARKFVEKLENVMIELVRQYGQDAEGQLKDRTGVWVHGKKIGAVGVRLTHGVSSHGIAFNVCANLQHYRHIIPCGLDNRDVTNLVDVVDREVGSIESVEAQFVRCFIKEFGYDFIHYPVNMIEKLLQRKEREY